MAHIPDGLLSVPVLVTGTVVAVAGVGIALRQITDREIPRIAILSATFFAISLISIPIGPSSIHLLLGGLMGVILGMGIFPAVLVALALQAVLFGFGGLTTLGINTTNIALPGAIAGIAVAPFIRGTQSVPRASVLAALASVFSVLCTGGLVALSLWLSSPDFVPAARILIVTYVPLAIVDAIISAVIIGFLKRVNPQSLGTQSVILER